MNILLGVTGSVAATLTPKMVRELGKLGNVEVVTTESGHYFIDDFYNDGVKLWRDYEEWHDHPESRGCHNRVWIKKGNPVRHIDLRKWAGVLVIAPLSANTMAKMANGICDNLLTSLYRAWDTTRPIVCAPAMNTMMWEHPVTAKQISQLRGWGVNFVDPQSKKLACADEGVGAMADISQIVDLARKCIQWFFPLEECSGIPVASHPGAFGTVRRASRHTGVDLYCSEGSIVRAVEAGRLLGHERFTGPEVGCPWWNSTDALLVEGASGVVCYGEMAVGPYIKDQLELGNFKIKRGQTLGWVKPVIKEGKERPDVPGHSRSMLHLELYERGRATAADRWEVGNPPADYLLDPTPWLMASRNSPAERLDMPSWPGAQCFCDKTS